ncbi:MFS transporter [Dactylosporangium fulvum]|uniref:MFS transporter n=1 Tax=Dactylosporangium fulvum TaxID=53359 RepID=A0ABY5VRA5_9ACTN|nr:MFS transporter [Dactylosporangium fulvum]UWP79334.1 MFS transporter [Dactylosporangium fulvum]
MGIGLVDPILPALSKQLDASPSQVSLLFTSYLLVTAVAMLVTNWVSSRLGAKRTLVAGLVLIVLFAGLAGTSDSIGGIVGFRAGWGLGNALFIATSLAIIVASASGGIAGAIILYETALGFGIAVGPLLGGYLGAISWRGPFFGVSVLMAIALILTAVLVPTTPPPDHHTSLSAPLKALKDRGLLIMSLTAVCYNWGFFTLLGYAPYPMHLSEHKLGLVFTGWGLLVALFSVAIAPRLQRRFGTAPTLYVNMVGLAAILAIIGGWTGSAGTVVVATIVSGAFIGINNTLTTQAVMTVAKVERPVASASYGFVRFIGGGLAPFVAGKLADRFDMHLPFFVGAGALLLAIVVLATGHRVLAAAERTAATPEVGELLPVATRGTATGVRPVVAAVDNSPSAATVTAKAAEVAARLGAPVELLHVHEVDIVGDEAVERESLAVAGKLVREHVERAAASVPAVAGHILRSVADHGNTGRLLVRHAEQLDAQVLVVGRSTGGPIARLLDDSSTQRLLSEATTDVLVVQPEEAAHGS